MVQELVLAQVLEARAAGTPDEPFLAMSGGVRYSYGEFNRLANQVMHGLRERGFGAGDRVAILLHNCPEYLIASYALKKLGAVEISINTNLRGPGMLHAFTVSQPTGLVTSSDLLAHLQQVLDAAGAPGHVFLVDGAHGDAAVAGYQAFASLVSEVDSNPAEHPRPSALATVAYTSGTTGPSKACMLSHQYGMTMGANMAKHLGILPSDCLYCPFPMYHVDAPYLTVAPALLVGGRAALGARFSVSGFWQEARDLGATVFDFMGATLTMLWKQEESALDSDNPVRLAWGVPVPPFKEEFERRFGLRITTGYGLTDGGMAVWADAAEDLPEGACGKARDPYDLRIVDADGRELPTGESGEILLTSRTPGAMMDGYLSMPDETSRVLAEGWLRTGDLGHLDGEGFLYFDGRKTDSIRRRGENISAWEVELVLESHPSVLEAAVIGVPSELTEEDVKAFVVLRAGHSLAADELRDYCRPRMAKYMVPDHVEFLDEIPRTPTGKTAKHLLPT